MPDMFRFALWKFYFKLMNNKISSSYLENIKPVLPRICDNYDIRRPFFHLPVMKYDFANNYLVTN